MAKKSNKPTISKAGFDRIARSLKSMLRRKYDEAKSDSAKPPSKASTQGAFDHVPALDSKTVAKWSSIVKKFLGCNLDPKLIRKGGYRSFDDFWNDMSAKLRATCTDSHTVAVGAPREART